MTDAKYKTPIYIRRATAKWNRSHPEKFRAYSKAFYTKNKAAISARRKAAYLAKKEKRLAILEQINQLHGLSAIYEAMH